MTTPTEPAHAIPMQPMHTARFKALHEFNNALMAFCLAGAAAIVWGVLAGGVPEWGERALFGLGIGGAIALIVSGLVIWRRARTTMAHNRARAQEVLDAIAGDGVATGRRATGVLMVSDRAVDAIEGFVADPASGRVAVVDRGRWTVGPASEVQVRDSPHYRGVVYLSLARRPDLSTAVFRGMLPAFLPGS